MLETLKTKILDAKDCFTTFEQRYVQNLMKVQDEMMESELQSLDKLNDLSPSMLDRLIAITAEELRNI